MAIMDGYTYLFRGTIESDVATKVGGGLKRS